MTWVKLDDHFDEHPKFAKVGPLGLALFVSGLAYCNRNLTDGFIPLSVSRNLLDFFLPDDSGRHWTLGVGEPVEMAERPLAMGGGPDRLGAEDVIPFLADAGLWHVVPGGYVIHDYHDYQPSKEEVLTEREKAAERKRKSRAKSNEMGDVTDMSRRDSAVSHTTPEPVPEPVKKNREENAGVFNNIADVVELTRRAASREGEAA